MTQIARETLHIRTARRVAEFWARDNGTEIQQIFVQHSEFQ
jgi:hypothetical protein